MSPDRTSSAAQDRAKLRFGIFHRPTGNFLDEFETREEAEAALSTWKQADERFEIVDFEEVCGDAK